MDPSERLRSWLPRLLFSGVVATLVLLGVIQYQWFSRSAVGEIAGTIRTLESGVRQGINREFQRYAPIVAELEALTDQPALSAQEAQALLDRLWSTYGPTGSAPNYLTWVGWTEPSRRVLHRREGNLWTVVALPDARWTEGAARAEVGVGQQFADVVVFRPSSDGPELLLGLDVAGFFAAYVQPALALLEPGSVQEWSTGGRRDPPPPGSFDTRTYAFNPFTALIAGPSLSPTLEVGIPKAIDLPWRSARERNKGDSPPAPGLRGADFWSLRLTLPPETPVLGVERRLAWNWLGSALLLVVLGVAFGFTLRQSSRLADLRRREREFVASVSHELRTPLTVIRSAADNFARGIVAPERQVRYGELILDQSLRLGRMIEEMLGFAQAEAAPPAPVRAPLVFEPWLGQLRPALEALASARSINLVWDVAGVPPRGLTDPEALRLVLENLVVNAVNHAYPTSSEGPRLVRIGLRHLVPDRLELTVDDDGRGIAPQEAKKVFEPFYRDQFSRNSQTKGSGLGLFLAHRQARRLGGSLRLESPWRRLDGVKRPGCRFVLTVPFHPEPEVPHGG